MRSLDENAKNAYYEDWLNSPSSPICSDGRRVTTAVALEIAADMLRSFDPTVDSKRVSWEPRDLLLARAAIAGIRAQQGVFGPDADALGESEYGLMATRQIDIWIYG